MSFLVDSHVLLWAAGVPDRLPADARTLIENPATKLIYRVASLWEVAIKNGLGRADFSVDPSLLRRGLLENGYTELDVTGAHVLVVHGLPPFHNDPFDRLLVAQALIEGVTMDEAVRRYPGPIRML